MAQSTAVAEQRSSPARDIFTDFRPLDWFFVVLLYVLILYSILQIVLTIILPDRFDFDFMPIVNGSAFVWVAWGGVRLDRRVREMFRRLDAGGGVTFDSVDEREAALQALLRLGRRYGAAAAALVGVSMLAGIAVFLGFLTGGTVDSDAGVFRDSSGEVTASFAEAAAMTAVCVPVGSLAGYMLGKMIGNGRLLDVLHDQGHDLSGFASESAGETLAVIDAIYAYATRATVVLTAVLGGWWIAFGFDVPAVSTYRAWHFQFAWLWAISFFAFVFAAYRPVMAFQTRLAQVYGGTDGALQARLQLDLTREDLAALRNERRMGSEGAVERRRRERRIKDLEIFIKALETRHLKRAILDRRFLRAWFAANAVALFLPLLRSGTGA